VLCALGLFGCANGTNQESRDVVTAPTEDPASAPATDGRGSPTTNPDTVPTIPAGQAPPTEPTTPTTIVTTTVVTTTIATTTTVPQDVPDVAPENLYAYAAAETIAERVNEDDLAGLDADEIVLVLEAAIEAAYEIEYPVAVETLEIDLDEDGPSVTIETGTVTDAGVESGKSYVCLLDGKAVASQARCGGN
jgi:hypothetical protein